MPCFHCRVLGTTEAAFAGLRAPPAALAVDLPVKLHPVALKTRVPTVPAFMRSVNAPHEHTGPEWQLIWDEPKICGRCGVWFSEPLQVPSPPSEGSEKT